MDLGSEAVESYLKVAVFTVLLLTSVRDEASLRRLIVLYLVAVHLYLLHSGLEFLNGRHEVRMGITRMIGVDSTYGNPNSFASSLLLTLPLAMALWACRPGQALRLFLLIHAAAVTGCVLLTGSRAGFIGLGACGLFLLLASHRREGAVLLIGGAGLLAGLALPGPLQNRFLTIIDPSYGPQNAQISAESRVEGLLLGLKVWQANPLFGCGPNSFGHVTKRGLGAHNVYGQVLSETGTAGAMTFLGVLACFALNHREARRLFRRLGSPACDLPHAVCRGVGMNVLLLLLAGWSGHNLFRYNWQWFAAFQIIALHCLRIRAGRVGVARPAQSGAGADWSRVRQRAGVQCPPDVRVRA